MNDPQKPDLFLLKNNSGENQPWSLDLLMTNQQKPDKFLLMIDLQKTRAGQKPDLFFLMNNPEKKLDLLPFMIDPQKSAMFLLHNEWSTKSRHFHFNEWYAE